MRVRRFWVAALGALLALVGSSAQVMAAGGVATQVPERRPSDEEIARVSARVSSAQVFVKQLLKSATPASAPSLQARISYLKDYPTDGPAIWACVINVRGAEGGTEVTETDKDSPERACTQAVLQMARNKLI